MPASRRKITDAIRREYSHHRKIPRHAISSVGYHFYLQSTPDLGGLMKKFGQGAWNTLK